MKVFLIIFILIAPNCLAQMPLQRDYIAVTFEVKGNPSLHEVRYFHWIVPQDSLSNFQIQIYPIFTELAFSFKECNELQQGFNGGISFVRKKVDSLYETINRHKKLYQKIKIEKYEIGEKLYYTEVVKVYVTPIKGIFCMCPIGKGFRKGYMPLGNFTINSQFWENYRIKRLSLQDFAGFSYQATAPW